MRFSSSVFSIHAQQKRIRWQRSVKRSVCHTWYQIEFFLFDHLIQKTHIQASLGRWFFVIGFIRRRLGCASLGGIFV
jgi:hypothetical protein